MPASEAHVDDAERREVPQPPPARHASSHAHPVLPRGAQSDMGDLPADEDEEAESPRARSEGESEADEDLEHDEVGSEDLEETDVDSDDELVLEAPPRRPARAARAAPHALHPHPHSALAPCVCPQPPQPRVVSPRPAALGSTTPKPTSARRR